MDARKTAIAATAAIGIAIAAWYLTGDTPAPPETAELPESGQRPLTLQQLERMGGKDCYGTNRQRGSARNGAGDGYATAVGARSSCGAICGLDPPNIRDCRPRCFPWPGSGNDGQP